MESKLRGSLRRLGAGARRLTHEAVPRLANYSNMFPMATTGARPTVEELHESIVEDKVYLTRLGFDYSTVYKKDSAIYFGNTFLNLLASRWALHAKYKLTLQKTTN